jgi:hypothetical protein
LNFADHSPTRPLTKDMEKRLSLSQETTPRASRVDKRARTRGSQDEEMKEIDEGTVFNLLKSYVVHACAVERCMLSSRYSSLLLTVK